MPDVLQPTEGFPYSYNGDGSASQALGVTDRGIIGVRVVKAGTKSESEHHPTIDAFAFVKSGQGRVLGDNNEVLAELKTADAVVLPADTVFCFESLGDADLEIVQTYASHETLTTDFRPFS